MTSIDVAVARMTTTERSEMIFLPPDGSVTPVVGDRCSGLCILTPSNPTYWWGNSLRMDAAPVDGDFARWMALFDACITRMQPESIHHAFAWNGAEPGAIEDFVAAGFEHFETISLGATSIDEIITPHPTTQDIVEIDGARWDSLTDLLVATRHPVHSDAGYRIYLKPRIAGWRGLEQSGQGRWFCIEEGGAVVAALGVFAERERGPDGRRIGRFQHVVTHPDHRRLGYAGSLVAHAGRYAFQRLDVDDLRISADANDVARRVYESCGFVIRSKQNGLERES
jgi:GNAT superfamily N-acetyltransferase